MYDDLVSLLRKKYDKAPMVMEAADAIEELSKRIDFLMNCIYEAEDALDRGADNEWARAALEKAEEKRMTELKLKLSDVYGESCK